MNITIPPTSRSPSSIDANSNCCRTEFESYIILEYWITGSVLHAKLIRIYVVVIAFSDCMCYCDFVTHTLLHNAVTQGCPY